MDPRPLHAVVSAPPARPAGAASSISLSLRDRYLLLFLGLHAPMAIALRAMATVPRYHALGVLALGVWWATVGRRPTWAVAAAGYISGAEILWRMTGTGLFWEFGKYGATLILLLVFLRLPNHRSTYWGALLYLVLLIPSGLITLQELGPTLAKDAISFNLSGPLSLAVAILFFSSVEAAAVDLELFVFSLLAPTLGVLAVCTYATLTAGGVRFYAESNYVTSGGFGPNQVSALLGLGAVLSLLLALQSVQAWRRAAFVGLTLWFLVQGVLTFSRGGVINAVICIGFLLIHLVRQPRVRLMALAVLVLFTFLGTAVIFPRLNAYTGGALQERYSSTATGMRQTLMEEELELWKENPVLGVGPGMSKYYRAGLLGMEVASHTEFTRLLSEHGTFGLLALLVLVATAGLAYLRAPSALEKAWVSALSGWTFIEMSHSAMRIMAISFLFGLAMVQWRRRD
ncbi:MAG: O-antigen ligase family protein [Thermoanaerobaculia bacterium]